MNTKFFLAVAILSTTSFAEDVKMLDTGTWQDKTAPSMHIMPDHMNRGGCDVYPVKQGYRNGYSTTPYTIAPNTNQPSLREMIESIK